MHYQIHFDSYTIPHIYTRAHTHTHTHTNTHTVQGRSLRGGGQGAEAAPPLGIIQKYFSVDIPENLRVAPKS